MKNLGIFMFEGFFFDLASLTKARQDIHYNISFSLTIINLEMISRELLGPSNLTGVQAFCIYKLTKVITIYKDKDLIFTAFQIVSQSFKNLNNSQKIMIVSLVPGLVQNYLSGKKSYQILLTIFGLWEFRMTLVGHVTRKMFI